ncbi:SRPBCC family protein [Pedobacter heparinus]|uniref:Cyclase/dehydrase n=1 Tax=Pedobacter heparinus (strain ATCC 13125 / DSM 2366 / CIP 104194 / JCM 7457 / NBRC 12017 / NCIMB 9290 / NRRL B-14731 / HIM 762-3) TaxID=485917 RepID=C6Y0B4_PEDHD|nr:SRPBCC family protein [Pedobacter heparinus]ACU04826.1 cyclase/dehydrase [Pedobacter heparinus DSM 2366]
MKNKLNNQIMEHLCTLSLPTNGKENIDQGERIVSLLGGSWLLYKSLKKIGKHPFLGLQGVAAGGLMLYRGATGICPVYQQLGKDTTDPQAINITEDIVVNAPIDKVYAFWREFSNLPKFMEHLKSVEEVSEKISFWTANTPGGLIDLNWNAEITREEKGSYLGWQSLEGSMIDNAGKIEFRETLNGTRTELHIEIDYFPPAGSVGRGIASLFNGIFERMIRQDIQRFKTYAEENDFKQYAGLAL